MSLGVKSFTPFGVGKAMQLLSQEKNQNSPDRRRVAHALIKHTVHVSTITLLRGFALSTERITERFYTVSYKGCKHMLYIRASGGVGLKWRRIHRRPTQDLGGHTGECPWVIHINTLLDIPTCVYPHTVSPSTTHMHTHADTHTVGYTHHWEHLVSFDFSTFPS